MEGFTVIPTWVLWTALIYGVVALTYICLVLTSINMTVENANGLLAIIARNR